MAQVKALQQEVALLQSHVGRVVGSAPAAMPGSPPVGSGPRASALPTGAMEMPSSGRPATDVTTSTETGPIDSAGSEPFMRVGSQAAYVEAIALVEQMPREAARQVPLVTERLALTARQSEALAEALRGVVEKMQPAGRAYLEGRLEREQLREQFLATRRTLHDALATKLSAAQLAGLAELEGKLFEHNEWLVTLVGDVPR